MGKNRLQTELDRQRGTGASVIDLSDTNFHRNGYRLPDALLEPLVRDWVRTRSYDPDSKGFLPARESIAAFYDRAGIAVDPANVIITASSSESYSHLFGCLAEPGDTVLLPSPTYPLFEYLAEYRGLRIRYYRMPPESGFRIDLESAANAVDERTKIIVVISPNNPTGQVAEERELRGLLELCERRGIAMIVDEVFSEFRYAREALARPAAFSAPVPVFMLNGVSKMFASPDLKLGWIAAAGAGVAPVIERLEIVNDTFLSCTSLSQALLPGLFAQAGGFTRDMVASLARKRELLIDAMGGRASIAPPRGGIHCPVRIERADEDDERFALELLRTEHLYVHPGYFYGFPESGESLYVVVSFLVEETRLREGLERLVRFANGPAPRAGESLR